ncbi:MAG: hypothetical protein VCB07_04450 [Gammaproteobacteria bacterium]
MDVDPHVNGRPRVLAVEGLAHRPRFGDGAHVGLTLSTDRLVGLERDIVKSVEIQRHDFSTSGVNAAGYRLSKIMQLHIRPDILALGHWCSTNIQA